jgi:hypothetical protein
MSSDNSWAGTGDDAVAASEPIDPRIVAGVLDDLVSYFTTYVDFVSPAQADAVALWCAYTHFVVLDDPEAPLFEYVPYLLVTSAEKRSGKTTLLELAHFVVREPLPATSATTSAVKRRAYGRTLLLDEIDAVYPAGGRSADSGSEELRAILNGGFHYAARVLMSDKRDPKKTDDYRTFGPKMLVGIGRGVPDTVQDRSIPIRLERMAKAGATSLPKARVRTFRAEADRLKSQLSELTTSIRLLPLELSEFPDTLSSRQEDIWEPLLSLARAVGPTWWERASAAAIELCRSEVALSLGEELLNDLRDLWEEHGWPDFVSSRDIIGGPRDPWTGAPATGLCGMEDRPWATIHRGGPVTTHRLAKMLGEYGVEAGGRVSHGAHGHSGRGYFRADLEPIWNRYPGVRSQVTPTTPTTPTVSGDTQPPSEPVLPLAGGEGSVPMSGRTGRTGRTESVPDRTRPTAAATADASRQSVVCGDYRGHQSSHHRTASGEWTCDRCRALAGR